MTFIKRIFAWAFKALAGLVVLIVIFFISLLFFSRQERAIAKDFIHLVAEHQFAQAHAMFSEEIQREYPLSQMRIEFENYQAYSKAWFTTVNIRTGLTVLGGQLTTETGCKSLVEFSFREGVIIGIHLPSPCLLPDKSA